MDSDTLLEIGRAAVNSDYRTIKRFVLTTLQKKGVKTAAIDLDEEGDE